MTPPPPHRSARGCEGAPSQARNLAAMACPCSAGRSHWRVRSRLPRYERGQAAPRKEFNGKVSILDLQEVEPVRRRDRTAATPVPGGERGFEIASCPPALAHELQ